nr:uncharacterized protein LOC107277629 [Oryza sativa Japonica Group]
MPWIRMEFNEPVHVAVAAPPPPLTQMQAGVNTSGEDLRPTTSASALTARSSCSTSSRRRASPPGSTPDPSPSAARVIFMSSYWLHLWSTMLPQEEQDTMRNGATLLESVAKGLLFHYGWRSFIRIAS